MPPDESVPLENLTTVELRQRAMAERVKRAAEETMRVRSLNTSRPWTDYVVTSERSGRTYRVALRSLQDGESYCSCPDFRTNRLGTCKHILNVQTKVKKRFTVAKLEKPYRRKRLSMRLYYGSFDGQTPRGVLFNLPAKSNAGIEDIVGDAVDHPMTQSTG